MRLNNLIWIGLTLVIWGCQPSKEIDLRWRGQLPPLIYEKLQRVFLADEWFEVYQVENTVYAIYETFQWQEVISHLILGTEKTSFLLLEMALKTSVK